MINAVCYCATYVGTSIKDICKINFMLQKYFKDANSDLYQPIIHGHHNVKTDWWNFRNDLMST